LSIAAVSRLEPKADAPIAEAQRRTRLDDFGPLSFETPLRVLAEAMRIEANLTEEMLQRQLDETVTQLGITLRTQASFAAHPEIEAGDHRTGCDRRPAARRHLEADPQHRRRPAVERALHLAGGEPCAAGGLGAGPAGPVASRGGSLVRGPSLDGQGARLRSAGARQ